MKQSHLSPPSATGSFLKILTIIFVFETAEMLLLKLLFPHTDYFALSLADSLFLVLFLAPFLWWLAVLPLQRLAWDEKTRSEAVRAQVVDAIVTVDEQGRIESFNPAAEKIFGYEASDIIGRECSLLFHVREDCLAFLLGKQGSGEGAPESLSREVTGKRRDGSFFPMDISVSRVLLGGNRLLAMIMRDITSQKNYENALAESEARFRQIFEQAEDAIVIIDSECCSILDVNPASERLYGYSRDEFIAQGFSLFVRDRERESFQQNVCPADRSRSIIDTYNCTRKDGTEIIVSARRKLISLQGREVIYCSFRDITEKVRMQEEARLIQAQLIHVNKMSSLGMLASGVAHEINNPNSFILSNLQMLESAWKDADLILKEYFDHHGDFLIGGLPYSSMRESMPEMLAGLKEGSYRIRDIIGNMKDYIRGKSVLDESVDLNKVVSVVSFIINNQVVKHTDRFQVQLAPDLPYVRGSSHQLEQVVINLVMNALQALPDRSRAVSVSTGYDSQAGQVLLKVCDEGVGIPDDMAPRILDPFFTSRLDSGGTGLGLSIANSIVLEHKGSLAFQSQTGKGTVFTVALPVEKNGAGADSTERFSINNRPIYS